MHAGYAYEAAGVAIAAFAYTVVPHAYRAYILENGQAVRVRSELDALMAALQRAHAAGDAARVAALAAPAGDVVKRH